MKKEYHIQITETINSNRFFGSLFENGDMEYISQVSHPQDRHLKLKQQVDFYKIYNPEDGRLMCVINLNYMFPIHKSLLIDLEYKNIENYRTFTSDIAKSKYIDLLNIEIKAINRLPIITSAIKIYENKYRYPNDRVSQRCFDFKRLEQACIEYKALKEKMEAQEQAAIGKEEKI
ncbi:protein AbiQ [Anaerobacterium chartisolvens]|uniref:Protein AbiQ n=1 Tax=Anaerobacterium chartisolvens TaxID=1297424 RepID=A0A369B9P0_9FIRM|nr:type III toxin-antitoxin system ToxN/AbiQ family toxin [Anaerobacterium chartisolvens]RCX18243.1 protein AbiQ [Anaerobacterium chartisolvens]